MHLKSNAVYIASNYDTSNKCIVELTPHYDIQNTFLFWIAVDCVGVLNKVAIECILHVAFYFARLLEPFEFQFYCHS